MLIISMATVMIIFVLFKPQELKNSVINSCKLVFFSVAPPLFCFILAGDMLISTPVSRLFDTKIGKEISKFIGFSQKGSFIFFCGLFFGFPSGAAMTSRLYSRGEMEKNEAQRLVALSNNPSPAFLVSVVGKGLLQSAKIGWGIYIS